MPAPVEIGGGDWLLMRMMPAPWPPLMPASANLNVMARAWRTTLVPVLMSQSPVGVEAVLCILRRG
jgi:hypothetical protein